MPKNVWHGAKNARHGPPIPYTMEYDKPLGATDGQGDRPTDRQGDGHTSNQSTKNCDIETKSPVPGTWHKPEHLLMDRV